MIKKITISFFLLACISFCAAQVATKVFNQYSFGPADTAYKYCAVDNDSFMIRYVHGSGYMSTLVGRLKCDSTFSIQQLIDSGFTKGNCVEDTAFYNADRHYHSTIQVYIICNGVKTKIGKEMSGYYVPHGCYEDVPEDWVNKAKN